MKITKIHLQNHPLFGCMEIDFTGPDGEPLSTIVLTGINGSGKTSLLMKIFELLTQGRVKRADGRLRFSDPPHSIQQCWLETVPDPALEPWFDLLDASMRFDYFHDSVRTQLEASPPDQKERPVLPKCIFLPSEINFNLVSVSSEPYRYQNSFINIIDEEFARSVPNFFATYIDRMVYENDDVPARDSIRHACEAINSIFDRLDLESRLAGLRKDGSRMPVFRNRQDDEFDISGLSSGEKQLFFRIMALKMVEASHSVILVDEPEISLHPAWQQRILTVYEHIGPGNQVFIATHSPHVIGSAEREEVKLLSREEATGRIRCDGYEVFGSTRGAPVEHILTELMGLDTTRDPDIQTRIDRLWEDIYEGDFDSTAFKQKFQELENLLGTYDEDLALMKLEIGRLEATDDSTC